MPSFCSVVDCSNRGMRDDVRFFRIPKALNFKHKTHLNVLSSIRRKKWILALKRNDMTESKLKYAQVCSNHFRTGKPAGLTDYMNPDWIPSVNMGHRLQIKSFRSSSNTRLDNLNTGIALKTEITEKSGVTETCSYFTCGMSVKSEPKRSRFRFPIRDPDRCKKWILNSGRPDLLKLSPEELHVRFICAKHFQTKYFFGKMLSTAALPDVCQVEHSAVVTNLNTSTKRKSVTKASITALEPLPGQSRRKLEDEKIDRWSTCESTSFRRHNLEDSKMHSISQQEGDKCFNPFIFKRRKNTISNNISNENYRRIKLKTDDVLVPFEQEDKVIPTEYDTMEDIKPIDTSIVKSCTSPEASVLLVISSEETPEKSTKEEILREHDITDVQEGTEENVNLQSGADNLTRIEEKTIKEDIEDFTVSDKSDGEKNLRQRVIILETDRIEIIIHEDYHEGEYTTLKVSDIPTWNPQFFLETETGIKCGTRSVAAQTNLESENESELTTNKKCQNCSLHCRSSDTSTVFEEPTADL